MKRCKKLVVLLAMFVMIALIAAAQNREDLGTVQVDSLRPLVTLDFTNEQDTVTILQTSGPAFRHATTGTIAGVLVESSHNLFKYQPIQDLQDGESYEFEAMYSDDAENQDTIIVSFTMELASLEISIIRPSYGVTSEDVFDVEIETSRDADCRYNFVRSSLDFDDPRNNEFDSGTSVGMSHVINDFELESGIRRLHVVCHDLTKDTIERQSFIIIHDEYEPTITDVYTNSLQGYFFEVPSEVRLTAITDELTLCKYELSADVLNEQDLDYNLMTELEEDQEFALEHTTTITPINLRNHGDEEYYYVICKDRAELLSDPDYDSAELDLDQQLAIIATGYPQYTQDRLIDINVTLNKGEGVICEGFDNSDMGEDDYLWGLSQGQDNERIFYKSLNLPNEDAAYTYYINCVIGDEEATTTMTIALDRDAPVMSYAKLVSHLENSTTEDYSTDEICFELTANETGSGIDRFNYQIIDKLVSGDNITQEGAVTSISTSGSSHTFDECVDIDLEDGHEYGLKANATNNAGMTSLTILGENTLFIDVTLIPESCDNLIVDGDETDIDCGGSCPDGCIIGEICDVDGDCASNFCNNGTCAATSCTDDVWNGHETDVDCGGNCPDCRIGERCEADQDCESGECDSASGRCIPRIDTCSNELLDPEETDVDCGGACPPCADGNQCDADEDCRSGVCESGICQTPTCEDNVKNGDESDVDCGGSCDPCLENERCNYDRDCESGVCSAGYCGEDQDQDDDGMSDSCELQYGLDPTDSSDAVLDNDGDGLSNAEECRYGTDPNNPDTDGDGATDYEEVNEGTDPLDPTSKPEGFPWLLLFVFIIIAILVIIAGYYGYMQYQAKQMMKPQRTLPQKSAIPPRRQTGVRREIRHPRPPVKMPVKKKEWVPLSELSKKHGGERTKSIFDNLSKIGGAKPKEKKDVFAELAKIKGGQVKKEYIKKIAKSAPKKDLLKSFHIISEKKVNQKVSDEMSKHLKELKKSHKHLQKEIKQVSEHLGIEKIYVASKDGKKFHKARCLAAKNIPKKKQITFKTKQEAIKKGYKPCSLCLS